jgi:hypothetical protein
MSLIGNLEEIKIADVLRLFAQGRKSGRLIVTDDEEQSTLRFQKGAVVHAHASHGRLSGEDAVLDLFGWKAGQLTFVPEEGSVAPNVQRGVDLLIRDGLRRGDAFHRMNQAIASDRATFQMSGGPADEQTLLSIRACDWRVLRLCDGSRDLRELVDAVKLPRSEVMRAVFEALEAGFLERVESQKGLRAQAQGLFGRETAELDVQIEEEWRKLLHFGRGVHRVEVRSAAGRSATLRAAFRSGLIREVHLPRGVFGELGLRDGEDVQVKPVD